MQDKSVTTKLSSLSFAQLLREKTVVHKAFLESLCECGDDLDEPICERMGKIEDEFVRREIEILEQVRKPKITSW